MPGRKGKPQQSKTTPKTKTGKGRVRGSTFGNRGNVYTTADNGPNVSTSRTNTAALPFACQEVRPVPLASSPDKMLKILLEPTTNTQDWAIDCKRYDGFIITELIVEWVSGSSVNTPGTLCVWIEADDFNSEPTTTDALIRCTKARGAMGGLHKRIGLRQRFPKGDNQVNYYSIAQEPEVPSTSKNTSQGILYAIFALPPDTTVSPGNLVVTFRGMWRRAVSTTANTSSTALVGHPAYAGLTVSQARLVSSGGYSAPRGADGDERTTHVYSSAGCDKNLAGTFASILYAILRQRYSPQGFPKEARNTLWQFDKAGSSSSVLLGLPEGVSQQELQDWFVDSGWKDTDRTSFRPRVSGLPDHAFGVDPYNFVPKTWVHPNSSGRFLAAIPTNPAPTYLQSPVSVYFLDTTCGGVRADEIPMVLERSNIQIQSLIDSNVVTMVFEGGRYPESWEAVRELCNIDLSPYFEGPDTPVITMFTPGRSGKIISLRAKEVLPTTSYATRIVNYADPTQPGGLSVVGRAPVLTQTPIVVSSGAQPLRTTDTNIELAYEDGGLNVTASQNGDWAVGQKGDYSTSIVDHTLRDQPATVSNNMLWVNNGLTMEDVYDPTYLASLASKDRVTLSAVLENTQACNFGTRWVKVVKHADECDECATFAFSKIFHQSAEGLKNLWERRFAQDLARILEDDDDDSISGEPRPAHQGGSGN